MRSYTNPYEGPAYTLLAILMSVGGVFAGATLLFWINWVAMGWDEAWNESWARFFMSTTGILAMTLAVFSVVRHKYKQRERLNHDQQRSLAQ